MAHRSFFKHSLVAAGSTLALLCGMTSAAADAAAEHTGSGDRLGTVSFANTCEASVQTEFQRSVALLHSFWWQAGEQAFGEVLQHDPHCAIATWGIAAILIGNPFGPGPSADAMERARQALQRGRAIGAGSERERGYIEAIAAYYGEPAEASHGTRLKALAAAFGELARRYPDDDEAQIFHALYLTSTQQPTDKSFAAALRAAEILEVQFARHPDHPGVAHYLIHSYDFPPIAQKGLSAARRYAAIAPSAPHAQHMPSHIFTRVGAWQDSARANERAAEVARQQNEPVDRLHSMDYMVYAYEQLGRDEDARALVDKAASLAESSPRAAAASAYAVAAMPARYALERGAWKEASALEVRPSPVLYAQALSRFARALGAARSGDAAAAERELADIARLADGLKAANNLYWAGEVEVQRLAAAAWVAHARGQREDGLNLMRLAADMEDKSEKAAVTPGRLVPARELLAEMLLEQGQAGEALEQFERSQARDPNRFRSLYGAARAAAQSGHADKAKQYFAALAEMADPHSGRTELKEALKQVGGS